MAAILSLVLCYNILKASSDTFISLINHYKNIYDTENHTEKN